MQPAWNQWGASSPYPLAGYSSAMGAPVATAAPATMPYSMGAAYQWPNYSAPTATPVSDLLLIYT